MIRHVITRVNPEKTRKKDVNFSRHSSYELGQRADLCSVLVALEFGAERAMHAADAETVAAVASVAKAVFNYF